jgi:asparagine synthase (glutamine-hydrolysing)
MCGIAGIVSLSKPVNGDIGSMTASMIHRGPDDDGYFQDDHVHLGFRRLSIIDLSTGNQPVYNEDRSIVAIFNGEVYNYVELRQELLANGHRLNSEGDSEVIVHLYEEYGIDFVSRLNGMFAIALWDQKQKRFYLVRDRLGIKPLYYLWRDGVLVFGSEVKAILQSGLYTPEIDPETLPLYLTYMYIPGPKTLFNGIMKLLPGHYISLNDHSVEEVQYWDTWAEPEVDVDPEEREKAMMALLGDAVRLQLRSDVPLGALLSGGIDSSLIVALASQHLGNPLETFTVKFEGGYDETPIARLVAERYGTHHHEFYLTHGEQLDELPDLIWHMDEPLADSGLLPNYLISKIAREHVKVVLTGTGGDELFGGYDHYFPLPKESLYLHLPALWRERLIEPLLSRPHPLMSTKLHRTSQWDRDRVEYHLGKVSIFHEYEIERLRGVTNGDVRAIHRGYVKGSAQRDGLNLRLYLDLKTYLVEDLLLLLDRMTMARGLEARVPLLDHRFVEFMFRVPGSLKTRKAIARRAAAHLLPEELFSQPKTGFAAPVAFWMRKGLGKVAKKLLIDRHPSGHPWWRSDALKYMFSSEERMIGLAQKIYTLLILELVYIIHVENCFKEPPSLKLTDLA